MEGTIAMNWMDIKEIKKIILEIRRKQHFGDSSSYNLFGCYFVIYPNQSHLIFHVFSKVINR